MGLGAGGAVIAAPLRTFSGFLVDLDDDLEPTLVIPGTFELQGSSGGDIRESPGTAELVLEGVETGTLTAVFAQGGHPNGARRVDPASGRPLLGSAPDGASCTTGSEPSCLPPGHCLPSPSGPLEPCDAAGDARAFRTLNSHSVGVTLDPESGVLTLFNSLVNLFTGAPATDPLTEPTVASFVSALLAANAGAAGFARAGFGVSLPLVVPNRDAGDTTPGSSFFSGSPAFPTLNRVLSAAQRALLGCGSFYDTDCDVHGIALFQTETAGLLQCLPPGPPAAHDYTDPGVPQPCTFGAHAEPVCTRRTDGGTAVLAGCRGPGDPGYDPAVDGTTSDDDPSDGDDPFVNDLIQPFFDPNGPPVPGDPLGRNFCELASPTGVCQTSAFEQRFANEMAVISWNLQMLLVGLSSSVGGGSGTLDPDDPFGRLPENDTRCSLRRPQLCVAVLGFQEFLVETLTDDPSGEPRRRWIWETGSSYEIETAGGSLEGFADWSFHALGPYHSAEAAPLAPVLFLLGPPEEQTFSVPDSTLVSFGPGPTPDPSDDRPIGAVVGLPEPSEGLLATVALAAVAFAARARRRLGLR